MMGVGAFLGRLRRSTFVQAARLIHARARRAGNHSEVGRDDLPSAEPARFAASDRMGLPANDVAGAEAGGRGATDAQVRVVANILGLAGSSPALPPPYSELQLQRRRARDFAFGQFLGIFDHRALSFFYRIAEKYSWPLQAERAGKSGRDPIRSLLVSLAGVGGKGTRDRLDLPDDALVTLVGHMADTRRSAASVETILRTLTGLPLRVVEATPTWMAVPPSEQTRIGGAFAQFAQLGQPEGEDEMTFGGGLGGAAMIGEAVLDAQHHYVVEVGPLRYDELQDFCCRRDMRRVVSQICALAAGIEQRPSLRLLIEHNDIPDLCLGSNEAPAMLGWTTWMGRPEGRGGVARDCLIPLDPGATVRKSA